MDSDLAWVNGKVRAVDKADAMPKKLFLFTMSLCYADAFQRMAVIFAIAFVLCCLSAVCL